MTFQKNVLGLLFALGTASVLAAQAPAGAPAGATGICKDGSYSMQAKKGGACRGHKGVQTWYEEASATPARSAPAPAPAPARAPAAMPGPANAAVTPSKPVPPPAAAPAPMAPSMPAPATKASTGKRLGPAAAAAQKPLAPGGGPGLVWVNTASNVYHCNGDPFYGKTKAGAYMSESDAKAKGARGDRGKVCTGK